MQIDAKFLGSIRHKAPVKLQNLNTKDMLVKKLHGSVFFYSSCIQLSSESSVTHVLNLSTRPLTRQSSRE